MLFCDSESVHLLFFPLFALVTRKLYDKTDVQIIIEPTFVPYLLIFFIFLRFNSNSISFFKISRGRRQSKN